MTRPSRFALWIKEVRESIRERDAFDDMAYQGCITRDVFSRGVRHLLLSRAREYRKIKDPKKRAEFLAENFGSEWTWFHSMMELMYR